MITVAIDGPSGVGKSSTSQALARHFGYAYLDTGAMYRAAAWWCLEQGADLNNLTERDEQHITELVSQFFTEGHFSISLDPSHCDIFSDGKSIDTD
ncbi:MAG: (d)CMP kinase, partial [Scardovia wiggsiae]